jgi:proline dehydrogenase
MLRNALLWASTNPTVAEKLPQMGFVQKATKRFMPGEELGDALGEAATLGEAGIKSTVTLLGENVEEHAEADTVVAEYVSALKTVADSELDTEVSVKLTQLGLDFGVAEATERLVRIAESTASLVWVDMEGSDTVDDTLTVFRAAKERAGNVGLCIQSYLHRTEEDLAELLPLDPAIRVVKGAYNEPPTVAYAKKSEVDRNFVRLTQTLLRARLNGGQGRPVLGTHDSRMIGETNRIAYELGLPKEKYEFGMLYGIERDEQTRLVRTGHEVRVLLSYGSAWFPWYMRRLAERPANLWFVAKQLVR